MTEPTILRELRSRQVCRGDTVLEKVGGPGIGGRSIYAPHFCSNSSPNMPKRLL